MNTTDELIHYLPGYDSNRKWGLCVSAIGSASIPPRGKYPVVQFRKTKLSWQRGRTLNQFAFIYISSGSGIFESAKTSRIEITPGSVIILFPGVWHRYRPLGKTGWDEHWITFEGEYADNLRKRGVLNPSKPVMQIVHKRQILETIQHLFDVVFAEKAGFQQRAAASTIQLLAEAHAMAQHHGTDNQRILELVENAKVIILKNINQPIDLKELARSLNMSYPWFRHTFKQQTGISPGRYHLELRINRAKRLLVETDLPVKNISDDLGFSSQYYFSRMFNRVTRLSPVAFRKQHI